MGAIGKGLSGIGQVAGAALPYAGAAAGGYAQGIQNQRQLDQNERQILLQETENEMRRRGLKINEEQHAAQFGPTSLSTGMGLGQAVGAPGAFGAALAGQPYNQARDQANLYLRDSGQDAKADISRIKAGGAGDPVKDALTLTREIRAQRQQVIGVYGRLLPRDAMDALLRDDVEIGAILKKYQGQLDPSVAAAFREIAILEMIRKQRYPEWYAGAQSAGQPPPGANLAASPAAPTVKRKVYNPATGTAQ